MIALCALLFTELSFTLRSMTFKTLRSKITDGFVSMLKNIPTGLGAVDTGNGGRQVT